MSAHADIQIAVQGIKLGALDFIEKPFEFDVLETTLQAATSQLALAKETIEARRNSHHLFDLLSPREIEVLLLLMDGHPNKVTAERLSLSVRTIEMHRAHALLKLGVRSIAEVVMLARDAGITLTPHK
jgi:two-component system response regulator FixJ